MTSIPCIPYIKKLISVYNKLISTIKPTKIIQALNFTLKAKKDSLQQANKMLCDRNLCTYTWKASRLYKARSRYTIMVAKSKNRWYLR